MTILDAYAVIAFLRDEPAAAEVAPLLQAGEAALTAVGLGEVVDQLVRAAGVDEEQIALDLAELGLHDAVVITPIIGAAGGRLRARRYHRTRCPISMADGIAAETARSLARPLATSDPHLLDVCHTESIDVLVLPDSQGARWTRPRRTP